MFLSLNKMEILDGRRNETNKIVFENHVYYQDYRYLNIFRCSQRCSANKCGATLIAEENHEDFHVEGMHNHATSPSVVEDEALRKEIKRLARETLDTSTDILRAASLM